MQTYQRYPYFYSLEAKINVNIKPIFKNRKLSQTLSVKENKLPNINA